jgi:DnaJ-class molecular chaperone
MRAFVESGGQRFYGFRPGREGGVRVNVGDIGDLFGEEGFGGGLFEDLFGFRTRGPVKGADAETEVELSFDDAVRGTTVTLRGGAKARIPAGVGDGARIKVAGKGERGREGGPAGDLYVKVKVREHPLFKLTGRGNVMVEVPVTIAEAALGAKVEVPTLDGSVTVKVPAGTQDGKVLRVRGKGAPRPRGGAGDLLVKVRVEIPSKLTRKEKEALERFQEEHKHSPRSHLQPYLGKKKRSAKAS